MLSYQQALDYIYSFVDQEKLHPEKYEHPRFDLSNMHTLLSMMGDPHRQLKAVHVAGTKGKGSTCAMIDSVLRAAGYSVGLFTQPHLHTFRERIQINGQLIEEEHVVDLVERLQPCIERLPEPSTFEIMTAMAFQHFADQAVDLAVIETGLGGRLDTTNVIQPMVAVITSISYDHTYILGDTLEEIAGEKAGIIKEGRPVVCAPQKPEAEQVIVETSQRRRSSLILLGREWTWERTASDLTGQSMTVQCHIPGHNGLMPGGVAEEFRVPFLGSYQVTNAVTALATLDQLYRQGIPLTLEDVDQGLRSSRWPGRLEILNQSPLLVMDGAHNVDSVQRLMAALREDLSFRRLIVVAGFSADKDIAGMMRELASHADELILTQSIHPRAAQPAELAKQAPKSGAKIRTADDVPSALWQALDLATDQDLVCVTGSLFVVAEARAAWLDYRRIAFPRDPLP